MFFKHKNEKIPEKNGSTIIGIPGLILCTNTPGKDESHESFPIISDMVIGYI